MQTFSIPVSYGLFSHELQPTRLPGIWLIPSGIRRGGHDSVEMPWSLRGVWIWLRRAEERRVLLLRQRCSHYGGRHRGTYSWSPRSFITRFCLKVVIEKIDASYKYNVKTTTEELAPKEGNYCYRLNTITINHIWNLHNHRICSLRGRAIEAGHVGSKLVLLWLNMAYIPGTCVRLSF